jgi:hypothetical protein
MKMSMRALCSALILLSAAVSADAGAHGRRGHWRGGVTIGIGVPAAGYYGGYGGYGGYRGWGYGYAPYGWYGPGAVIVAPPPLVYAAPPGSHAAPEAMPAPPPPGPPDPIFYPRQNQGAAQLEADRQACNRWATTQPSAMADASVFHRATLACMEGRGYSAK